MKIPNSRIVKNISWNVSGIALAKVLTPFLTILIARKVGPNVYGTFTLALMIVSSVDVIKDFGMSEAFLVTKNKNLDIKFYTYLTSQFLFSLLLVFVIILVTVFFYSSLGSGQVIIAVRYLSITILFKSISEPLIIINQKKQKYSLLFFRTLIPSILNALIAYSLVLLGFELNALIIAYISSEFLLAIFFSLKSEIKLTFKLEYNIFINFFSFGKEVIIQRFFTGLILSKWDIYALGYGFSETIIGLYRMAQNLMVTLPRALIKEYNQVLYTEILEDRSIEKIKNLYKTYVLSSSIAIYLVAIIFNIYLEPVVDFLLGSKWLNAIDYIKSFSMILPFIPMKYFHLSISKMKGFYKKYTKLYMIYGLVFFIIIYFLVMKMNPIYISIAYSFLDILFSIIMYFIFLKNQKHVRFLKIHILMYLVYFVTYIYLVINLL